MRASARRWHLRGPSDPGSDELSSGYGLPSPTSPPSLHRRGLIAEIKASKEPTKVLADRLGCSASNVSEPCSAGSAARASEGREACPTARVRRRSACADPGR